MKGGQAFSSVLRPRALGRVGILVIVAVVGAACGLLRPVYATQPDPTAVPVSVFSWTGAAMEQRAVPPERLVELVATTPFPEEIVPTGMSVKAIERVTPSPQGPERDAIGIVRVNFTGPSSSQTLYFTVYPRPELAAQQAAPDPAMLAIFANFNEATAKAAFGKSPDPALRSLQRSEGLVRVDDSQHPVQCAILKSAWTAMTDCAVAIDVVVVTASATAVDREYHSPATPDTMPTPPPVDEMVVAGIKHLKRAAQSADED